MAKNLKLNIKNIQLGKTAGLEKLKAKLAGETKDEVKQDKLPVKKEKEVKSKEVKSKTTPKLTSGEEEKPRRIRAKTKSDFAPKEEELPIATPPFEEETVEEPEFASAIEEIVEQEVIEEIEEESVLPPTEELQTTPDVELSEVTPPAPPPSPLQTPPPLPKEPRIKLGPTGRHVKDLYTSKKEVPKKEILKPGGDSTPAKPKIAEKQAPKEELKDASSAEDKSKGKKVREFKDFKTPKKDGRPFDARSRQGLVEDDEKWRKRRVQKTTRSAVEEQITRPTQLKIRLPISIKDLASEMKLKASELIQKLFMQGIMVTLNDILDDETTVLLLGEEFGCTIQIDTSEEKRIQVTSQTVSEEIGGTDSTKLEIRPPIVTFMGHVDHGKTSLIDAIRKSNRAAGEAGAITQHIGAFRCKTAVGDLTILDTPGHEAFSAMRARGAYVTDIIVLVVAGDEGIREQTLEAIQHAKLAKVTIVVAINKADKPNFNAENIYRQLSDADLLPEVWGGQTITVNTSATTGKGVPELLEMLALQAEVLNLKADPHTRARGIVIESQLQKGLGQVATILIQNGSLRLGDALIIDNLWGKVKTMRNELGKPLKEAGPSSPVEITGLSGLPKAGDAFVVVKSEKEAREIAEARLVGMKQKALAQKKTATLESLMQKDAKGAKKILKIVLRADVQGSLEAVKTSLQKIHSTKVAIEIIFEGIGDISESDIELAAASQAVIIGFHTQIESHASSMIKEFGVTVRLHNIIYHAVDDVKVLMQGLLEKIEEEKETGSALVQATFKASQLGIIAGCIVTEGSIHRNNRIRIEREGKVVWKGAVASLKRVKEDVREVKKGLECGILLDNFNDVKVGDIIQAYELIYHIQEI